MLNMTLPIPYGEFTISLVYDKFENKDRTPLEHLQYNAWAIYKF